MYTEKCNFAGIEVLIHSFISISTLRNTCKTWIPDSSTKTVVAAQPHLEVTVEYGDAHIEYHDNGFLLRGLYDETQMSLDFAMILSRYLERCLNEEGKYSIHSSCVSVGNRAFLLAGHAGAGKTTTAAACHLRRKEIAVLSGDRTVIEGTHVIAGTTVLSFKAGSKYDYNTLLSKGRLLSPDAVIAGQTIVPMPWEGNLKSYELAAIFIVSIGGGEPTIKRLLDAEQFLHVYGHFSFFANSFPTIVFGQLAPLPDTSIEYGQERRILFVKELLKHIPVIHLSGDVEERVESLLSYIDDDCISGA